jgi:hypothetical protein
MHIIYALKNDKNKNMSKTPSKKIHIFAPKTRKSLCNSTDFRQTCFREMSFAKIGTSYGMHAVVPFFKLAQMDPMSLQNQYEK